MSSELYLVHLTGQLKDEKIENKTKQSMRVVIGRYDTCDVTTEEEFDDVSGRHCVVSWTRSGLFVTDVGSDGDGSLNGTFINDSEPRLNPNEPQSLRPGDTIRLGYEKLFMVGPGRTGGRTRTRPNKSVRQTRPFEWLEVNEGRRQVKVDGKLIHFSPQEFTVIAMLWNAGGNVCTNEDIHRAVWPEDSSVDLSSRRDGIYDLIRSIREKLKEIVDRPVVQTVARVGYRFRTLRTN